MKIGKKFNTLTFRQYLYVLANRDKYTDLNPLGLYRSIIENDKLTTAQRIELRDESNLHFGRTFEFLQVKDPRTYFALITLGLTLTNADRNEIWRKIQRNERKILKQKRIKHRNFGPRGKHTCEQCPASGVMTTPRIPFATAHAQFQGIRPRYAKKQKVERFGFDQKRLRQMFAPMRNISAALVLEYDNNI